MNSITGTPSLTFLDLKNSEDRIRTLVSIYDPSLTDEDLKKCQNDPDPYDLMDDRIELIVNEILPILDLDTPPCDDALRQLSLDKFQHECDLRDVPGYLASKISRIDNEKLLKENPFDLKLYPEHCTISTICFLYTSERLTFIWNEMQRSLAESPQNSDVGDSKPTFLKLMYLDNSKDITSFFKREISTFHKLVVRIKNKIDQIRNPDLPLFDPFGTCRRYKIVFSLLLRSDQKALIDDKAFLFGLLSRDQKENINEYILKINPRFLQECVQQERFFRRDLPVQALLVLDLDSLPDHFIVRMNRSKRLFPQLESIGHSEKLPTILLKIIRELAKEENESLFQPYSCSHYLESNLQEIFRQIPFTELSSKEVAFLFPIFERRYHGKVSPSTGPFSALVNEVYRSYVEFLEELFKVLTPEEYAQWIRPHLPLDIREIGDGIHITENPSLQVAGQGNSSNGSPEGP